MGGRDDSASARVFRQGAVTKLLLVERCAQRLARMVRLPVLDEEGS
jgi:hypothetical protein